MLLENRGCLRLFGKDATSLLQGLVSNDLNRLAPDRAIYTTLLTPQGKFLFDFLVHGEGDALVLETAGDRLADLQRRLTLYRLRADVVICAIGIPALAAQATALAAIGGRVSLFAGFSKNDMGQIDINAIHYNELEIHGAFGLSRADYANALSMIANGLIETASMITHSYPLEEADRAFVTAEAGDAIKVAVLND